MENKKVNLYDETLRKLRENKSKRLSGDIIAIPWSLPRLSRVLPGIEPESYVILTSGPKAGKSQITNFLYLFQPIDYLFEHPESNLDVKIYYFSLEINKLAIMRQAISYRLFSKYGITVSQQKLLSSYRDYILGDDIEALIEKEKPWFEFLESKLDLNDEVRNATGIYKYVQSDIEQHGIWTYKIVKFRGDDKVLKDVTVKDSFHHENVNLINIVIVDHISLLNTESSLDQRATINRFSSEYCISLRDRYKCCVVVVQQQSLSSEQQQFTSSGKSILEKLKPSADGLGNSKETSRDCSLMLGLFSPHKFGFASYKDYDIDRLRDNHRELSIILNRNGISNSNIDLIFNGGASYFKELPRPEDMTEEVYLQVESMRGNIV